MKTCPVCALDLEDTYLFCPDDGSSLADPVSNEAVGPSGKAEPAGNRASSDETVDAVVLYCPTCAAEYPLTFSACPVHDLQLTRHKVPRVSNLEVHNDAKIEGDNQPAATEARPQLRLTKRSNRLTSLDLQRPRIESSRPVFVAGRSRAITLDCPQPASVEPADETDAPFEDSESARTDIPVDNEVDQHGMFFDVSKEGSEHRSFRVAAIATVIVLALLSLAALYSFASRLSRRTSSSAARVSNSTEAAQPLPLVPTPQEAQDYKEPQPASADSSAQEARPEPPAARKLDAGSSVPPVARNTAASQPTAPATRTSAPAPSTTAVTRVSNPAMPVLPRGNSNGFDARLVRVRARRTPSGFSYDMTFNLQEQTGRSAHWQRLLISSRSASGASHSQAIPFVHRLGGTGALTFTVSVEMSGRSESDWQGRVICTALGWDNNGVPVQASFGANVTP